MGDSLAPSLRVLSETLVRFPTHPLQLFLVGRNLRVELVLVYEQVDHVILVISNLVNQVSAATVKLLGKVSTSSLSLFLY